jgi:hypothetical protein
MVYWEWGREKGGRGRDSNETFDPPPPLPIPGSATVSRQLGLIDLEFRPQFILKILRTRFHISPGVRPGGGGEPPAQKPNIV